MWYTVLRLMVDFIGYWFSKCHVVHCSVAGGLTSLVIGSVNVTWYTVLWRVG